MKSLIVALFVMILAFSVSAEIQTETVEYKHGDITLQGYQAYDEAMTGKRPGVMVVHEWTGINDYTRMRVEELAKMGYVAFACDIYGKGVRPENTQEASEQAKKYRDDRELMRARARAGLEFLKMHDLVDRENIAAIGYCFGGGVVLELARSGADVAGVVSFHGNLDTPDPSDAENIMGRVLVCHGAADPYVPMEQVEAFWKEMNDANIDWVFTAYGNAVHSFTNPNSGDDPSQGAAYNEKADKRSWQDMKDFFDSIFE